MRGEGSDEPLLTPSGWSPDSEMSDQRAHAPSLAWVVERSCRVGFRLLNDWPPRRRGRPIVSPPTATEKPS